MNQRLRYATALWLVGAFSFLAVTLAIRTSINVFQPIESVKMPSFTVDASGKGTDSPVAISLLSGSLNSSSLGAAQLGFSHEQGAIADSGRREWVEVETSVNMRTSPSSAMPVLSVQPKGATLIVVSRKQNWVEVFHPDNKTHGWVFSRFVRGVDPPGQEASAIAAGAR